MDNRQTIRTSDVIDSRHLTNRQVFGTVVRAQCITQRITAGFLPGKKKWSQVTKIRSALRSKRDNSTSALSVRSTTLITRFLFCKCCKSIQICMCTALTRWCSMSLKSRKSALMHITTNKNNATESYGQIRRLIRLSFLTANVIRDISLFHRGGFAATFCSG